MSLGLPSNLSEIPSPQAGPTTLSAKPAESGAEPPKSERDSLALVRTVSTSNQRSGVAHALDSVLNLSDGGASHLLGALGELSLENMEGYLQSLADLLKRGGVGYEYREVNGRPTKVFVDVAIGSDLHRAPLVRDGRLDTFI